MGTIKPDTPAALSIAHLARRPARPRFRRLARRGMVAWWRGHVAQGRNGMGSMAMVETYQ